ncbi:Piso0_002337 [Millerozyma farinosa CBS 7064]|uniref:Piso0_002337 protein n=1 Tax=Pichia sorbitophila (strain ATCC MYA-4447 / BCRC 22081 / CBS 7064 / NBRC 10061 / NRRL Y-12695) TaxID=559304 RepID=G8YES5_PICSO|nr:Piso0_002337 [Millerozyma farinosa CBS 7064]
MTPFIYKTSHRNAVLSLYKQLIKKSHQLKSRKICLVQSGLSPSLEVEKEKMAIDMNLYMRYLSYEINTVVRNEFKKHRTSANGTSFLKSYLEGMDLLTVLNTTLCQGSAESWGGLLEKIQKYRNSRFRASTWRYENMTEKANLKPNAASNTDSRTKKTQVLKSYFSASEEHSQWLLRNYLKKLQTRHEIPIPHLLPYTPDVVISPVDSSISTTLAIPGSTKASAIEAAYDMEYIESIIKPAVEYDINWKHNLSRLQEIVTEKGPYEVKIKVTEAGPMKVPYIKLPYTRKAPLREIALDIKKSMRLIRIYTVWNSENGNNITEEKNSDGSYSVKGSHGYSDNERMYTKEYYNSLGESQGMWEYFLERELNGENKNDIGKYINEWTEELETVTDVIKMELDRYYEKYKFLTSRKSPLLQERKDLQIEMNEKFNNQLMRYNRIIDMIENRPISKHMDIVNPDRVDITYSTYISEDEEKSRKEKKGIPELSRVGMGKNLADYLHEVGHKYYKWGMRFAGKIDW